MDQATVTHYDTQAAELCAKYESADVSDLHRLLLRHLPEKGTVLEIGCGSGRDAAFLSQHGYDVTAVDASAAMLESAVSHHPELSGRTLCQPYPFPEGAESLGRKFQAVVSIATFMHIPDQDLFEGVYQIRQLLDPGGIVVLSQSTGRDGVEASRDAQGRLFIERPPEEIRLLFERLGFRFITQYDTADAFSRNVQWHTLVFQAGEGQAARSVDQIESIISRDKKDATYKLALLRALADIAQTEHFRVTWRNDGTVAVPLGLVAEKWLYYYWPLIEPDVAAGRVVIPQKRGMEVNKPIAFRQSLRALIDAYGPLGGLSAFHQDYRNKNLTEACSRLADQALNTIARTIVVGPVTFAGGSLDREQNYFGFDGPQTASGRCTTPEGVVAALGEIRVPAGAWRELCLIGHWVAESIVLRWAELTHDISERSVEVSAVVDKLLAKPSAQRDVQFARNVYAGVTDLQCVWTHQPLRPSGFAVDHLIPFSLWYNNDLWNLLPASRAINSRKSDKLIARTTLCGSKDLIVHYWETMRDVSPHRFDVELSRSLVRGNVTAANWQNMAFGGLLENVEMLAAQRGLERWSA